MRLSLTVFCAFTVAMTFAAERPAPPSSSPSEDGIAAARREFEAIKAARDGMAQPKENVPQLNLPTLETRATDPGLSSTQKKKTTGAEKKSANWLIEAMNKEKKDARKERDRAFDELTRRDSKLPVERHAEEESPLAEETAAPEKKPERPTPGFNPLTQYLGDWMTPQDYALLQPSLRDPEAGSFATRGNPTAALSSPGIADPTVAETSMKLLGLDKPATFTPPDTKQNPYLQPIELPATTTAVFTAPLPNLPPPPARSAPNIFAPPPAPPPAQGKVPDFVRPLPDEKHFKQLKRF